MKIKLKLFATLSDHLPEGARANTVAIEVPDHSSPNAVLDRFQVPREMVHLVLINGVYISDAQREQPVLKTGDELAIWPPVAGG